jgi:hypothetical protein
MPKKSPKRSPNKNKCSRCGKIGHNKNNKKYHSLGNKESPSKYERCVMDVKEKQSKWCKENNYGSKENGNSRFYDPTTGKSCVNPYAVCSRLR